jgi:hypothetical protein
VLISILGLTVFVKYQINWLNRFHSLPSGKEKDKNLRSSPFLPLTRAKAFRLSFHKKHKCLTGYIGGQKSTSSGVPIHASIGVLLLVMQALLVTLIVIFLITSLQLVEENQAYLGFRANRQVKIDKRLVKDHFTGVGAPDISVNP